MKVSLNWIKEYTKIDLPVDKLVEKIGSQLGAVEEVIDVGKKYEGIVVAKVVSCEAHPNADKLSLCKIDDGKAVKSVERDKDGHVQVVCGAPNVRMGQLVAWLPPGTTVPSTLEKDPLVLESRNIRGHVSHGMLASAAELDLSEDHTGILVLEDKVRSGTPFAKALDLDDQVIDIENKMFTHRPDCFGIIGVAREIAGITHQTFKSPSWYLKAQNQKPSAPQLKVIVKNQVPKLVPRFTAIAIKNVRVGPSNPKIQSYLARVGIKPINNVVDATNFIMYLTGQPLHAYDYDKVDGQTLTARSAKKGEKITLLGGKQVSLDENDIVIADNERAVGIGGVMGGADTEVSDSTKNIILECATFDKYSIHRTAMRHGLFTDAVTRFSKGQSAGQNDKVVAYAAKMIAEVSGGKVASDLEDVKPRSHVSSKISVTSDFINIRLGLNLTAKDMAQLLSNVEIDVKVNGQKLGITAPFWRTDLHIAEDVVEEIGRLYGYDHLPLTLPKRDLSPAVSDPLLKFKSELRDALSSAGANEVLTYSFVHGNLLASAGQNSKEAFQIANAISPDLQYYRLSLIPSLLETLHPNVKAGVSEFAIFEINKTHHKSLSDAEKLPAEEERLALVFAADDKAAKGKYSGAPYYQAAKYLEKVLTTVGIRPIFTPLTDKDYKSPVLSAAMAPFAKNRSAYVNTADGEILGIIGEFNLSTIKALKLPGFSAGFEFNILQLMKFRSADSPYVVQSRYPKVEQDICLKVKSDISFQTVADFVWDELVKIQPENVNSTLMPVDIFQKETGSKQITLRLSIAAYDRTLESKSVNGILDAVAQAAKAKLGATRV